MNEWRWKNQYIDLIGQKRDRIFSAVPEEELSHTTAKIRTLCSNYDEVVCELGSGSGGHIISHAEKCPRTLFIGFELRYKRAFRTIEKAEQKEITNLYMVQGDARSLTAIFPDQRLAGIYINFPDPWDKKRWQKHRLITPEFLGVLGAKIAVGGFFSHKTDHAEYFGTSVENLRSIPVFDLEVITDDLHNHPASEGLMLSEFEMLFRSKRLPVHYLLARRNSQ